MTTRSTATGAVASQNRLLILDDDDAAADRMTAVVAERSGVEDFGTGATFGGGAWLADYRKPAEAIQAADLSTAPDGVHCARGACASTVYAHRGRHYRGRNEEALRAHQFVLYYQPNVSLHNGAIAGGLKHWFGGSTPASAWFFRTRSYRSPSVPIKSTAWSSIPRFAGIDSIPSFDAQTIYRAPIIVWTISGIFLHYTFAA
jgi:hypothetical protein